MRDLDYALRLNVNHIRVFVRYEARAGRQGSARPLPGGGRRPKGRHLSEKTRDAVCGRSMVRVRPAARSSGREGLRAGFRPLRQ